MPIILGSGSPRRSELLKLIGIEFSVVVKETDESYPRALKPEEIAVYIAENKAKSFTNESFSSTIITADTVVSINNSILGKPQNQSDAYKMLETLSGNVHEVITAVSIVQQGTIESFYDVTKVFFNPLTVAEINYYINQYNPIDKAGSYGIQEWIGLTAIKKIEGSYTNVMGLPTEKLYNYLKNNNLIKIQTDY